MEIKEVPLKQQLTEWAERCRNAGESSLRIVLSKDGWHELAAMLVRAAEHVPEPVAQPIDLSAPLTEEAKKAPESPAGPSGDLRKAFDNLGLGKK